jgi:hypothetical protein
MSRGNAMSDSKYYDGTKLLSMKDLNGLTPEIFMTTTNRSAGKTTYFNRLVVNRYKKTGKKFILVYRFNYELVDCANKFFKEINKLFFKDDTMTEKRKANGIYVELFLNEQSCGYCVSINYADQLKKFSHLLADADCMLFDEFQSETNHYVPSEVSKFMSLHTSIARGGGEQVRYLPVYMISNAVSIINPYYMSMGIADRLQKNTNYLKGDGFILEQGFYQNVADEQVSSAFNRAFKNEQYLQFAAQNVYLNDNENMIEKMSGISDYIVTLKNGSKFYGIRRFKDTGLIYVDNRADETYPDKIVSNAFEQDAGYMMLGRSNILSAGLRNAFEHGYVRFRNQECKSAFFNLMNYQLFM